MTTMSAPSGHRKPHPMSREFAARAAVCALALLAQANRLAPTGAPNLPHHKPAKKNNKVTRVVDYRLGLVLYTNSK